MIKEYKEKQPKPKKEKPVKAPKAPKPEKEAFGATFNNMGSSNFREKPQKERKAKAEKPVKAEPSAQLNSFGGSGKQPKERKQGKKHSGLLAVISIACALVIIFIAAGYVRNAAKANEVESVALSSLPDKVVYYVGEEPSYHGLQITTTYQDGTSVTVNADECQFSGFDSRFAAEEQAITVTYGEHSFIFNVTIKERPRPLSPLAKITLTTLPKTEYKVGDWLSVKDGVLRLEYEDGSTRDIRLEFEHIYDFTTEEPGTYTITVKVVENGYLQKTTYTITVTE